MLSPVRVTPPTVMPVSWDEAAAHLRLNGDVTEKPLVESLIAAATEHLDGPNGRLGRALITQTWRVDRCAWAFPFRLPLGPVQEVVSVKYSDTSNAETVLDPSAYSLHADAFGGALHLAGSAFPPSLYSRPDAVQVTFTAGYGPTPVDVPAPIRQAILLLVGAWYENREETVIGVSVSALPRSVAVDALLTPYRVFA